MARLIGIATRNASRAPMETADAIEVTIDRGVGRDKRGKPGLRQVTVLSKEAWERACDESGAKLAWTARRANLLVEGVDLDASTGKRLHIGDVVLEVSGECDPCRLMDEQHGGLRAAMAQEWRGGASCRVVAGGRISLGDPVSLER